MLRTKDAVGFLSAFRGLARHVVTIAIPGEAASMGAGALYDAARAAGLDAAPAEDLEDAMLQLSAWARAHARETPPRILICGSLYLAGKVLAENGWGAARVAREQVQWTCKSDERREHKRAAGELSQRTPDHCCNHR